MNPSKVTPEMITPAMIDAAKLVMAKQDALDKIKPVVIVYQKKILADHQWPVAAEWADNEKSPILDPSSSFLLDNDDFMIYVNECHAAATAAGIACENPEHCPMLVAEHELIKAKWALCDAFEPITGLKCEDVTGNLEHFRKYVELCLKLINSLMKIDSDVINLIKGN